MDITATTETISACELLCETSVEQSVEGEFTIPDYQPPIWKIVKTRAEPVITGKLCVGSRATVEGYVKLTVLYCTDAEDRLLSLVQRLPFSKQLELRSAVSDRYDLLCSAAIVYLNCRAVNQRRIDVRGAVDLSVRLLSQMPKEVLVAVEGAGMQQREGEAAFVQTLAQEHKQFTLDEVLELSATGQEVTVLGTQAAASVTQTKVDNGRAHVQGEVVLTVTVDHSGEDGLLVRRWGYAIPFEQVVELDGDTQGCEAYADVRVVSCSAMAQSGREGVLDASVSCDLTLYLCCRQQTLVVTDAFSTLCETAVEREKLSVVAERRALRVPFVFKETVDKQGAPVDWYLSGETVSMQPQGLIVAGTLCIVTAQDGVLSAQEHPVSFTVPTQVYAAGKGYLEATVILPALECVDSSGSLLIKGEGTVEGCLLDVCEIAAVRSVKADESRPKSPADAALYVYYAAQGEDVWTIARKFGAAPDGIARQNGIEGEMVPEEMPLLIPVNN